MEKKWEGVDWNIRSQDRNHWQELLNFDVPQNANNIRLAEQPLASQETFYSTEFVPSLQKFDKI
jgi:hypothetical protein